MKFQKIVPARLGNLPVLTLAVLALCTLFVFTAGAASAHTVTFSVTSGTPTPTLSTPTSATPFCYISGGVAYAGNEWSVGIGDSMTLGLYVDVKKPVNLTFAGLGPTYNLNNAVTPLMVISNSAGSTTVVADYGLPPNVYTTLTFNIPSSALVVGDSNRIKITAVGGAIYLNGTGAIASANSEINLYNGYAAAPPSTYAVAQPDFDILSWNMFFAMNWPAVTPDSGNGYQRGFPNTNSKFTDASTDLVWETFKNKTEIFHYPPGPVPVDFPAPWNSQVTTDRTLSPGAKLFNSLNETVEVASEGLEYYYTDQSTPSPVYQRPVAPRVYLGQPMNDQSNAVRYEVKVNYDYYKYLTEFSYSKSTTGIGSPEHLPLYLDVNSIAAAGNPSSVNRGLNPPPPGYPRAYYNDKSRRYPKVIPGVQPIRLPLRTSAATGANNPNPNYNYTAEATLATYANNQGKKNVDPPKIGSVHIKAGWIPTKYLPATGKYSVAAGTYHTALAQYFTSATKGSKALPAPLEEFALIGLHIIQRLHTVKVKSDGTKKVDAPGGSFIFSTWEHENNEAAGFTYTNYYNSSLDLSPGAKPSTGYYPPLDQTAYPVTRIYDILPNVELVNAQVRQAIINYLGGTAPGTPSSANKAPTPWLHYKLIGTQYMGVNANKNPVRNYAAGTLGIPAVDQSDNDPTGIGMPVYLSNSVIETNVGLQQFQGTPPLTQVIKHYQQRKKGSGSYTGDLIQSNVPPYGSPSDLFHREDLNLAYNGRAWNMGGCMGCHGVAQNRGYSFSFVLLGGQSGADPDSETNFAIPPIQTDKSEAIDLAVNPPTTSYYQFTYGSGGMFLPPKKSTYAVGSILGAPDTITFNLMLTAEEAGQPFLFTATVAAVIGGGRTAGFLLTVKTAKGTVVSDQPYTYVSYHNLSWTIPSDLLTSGANTITLAVSTDSNHQTGMWINRAQIDLGN